MASHAIVNELAEFVYDKLARIIIASLSKLNPQLLSSLTKKQEDRV